jgi:hypothetical protein
MPDKTEWLKLNGQMPDGGPVYTETDLSEMIAEPWNALSSLTFLIPAIYWIWKCRGNLRGNFFLLCCCFLLAAGGIGSTLFHAFRKFPLMLLMDVLPIILLTVLVSIYFWLKILPKWWLVFFIIFPGFAFRLWVMSKLSSHESINIGYFISGTLIFLPLLFILIKKKFLKFYDIILSVLFLSVALYFRKIDAHSPPLMAVGTHWLWHVFCAAGAHFIGAYIYYVENSETPKQDS